MADRNRYEKLGALGIGVMLAQVDGGASAARAAPGALASLMRQGVQTPEAFRRVTDRIKDDLAQFRDFTREDWHQVDAYLDKVNLTPQLLAEHAADPETLAKATCRRLDVDPKTSGGALFGLCIASAFRAVCDDPALLAEAQPLLIRDMRQEQLRQGEALTRILDRIEHATTRELATLARAFGLEPAAGDGAEKMRGDLLAKAAEHQRLTNLFDVLDKRAVDLGRLQAAADKALALLDFTGVEARLSDVDRVRTEMLVETRTARALNALLLDDAAKAFDHLSSAADCHVTRTDAALFRVNHAAILDHHAHRYGGQGSVFAERMLRQALGQIDAGQFPAEWALAMRLLGSCLAARGDRAPEAEGIELLHEAIEALRAAASGYEKLGDRRAKALVQVEIATALQTAGKRAPGETGTDALRAAFDGYSEALEVFQGEDDRSTRAAILSNIGVTLTMLGCRATEGTDLLRQARSALLDAYGLREAGSEWLDMADILTNLALVELAFAEVCPGRAARHRQKAHEHLDAAEAIYRRNNATVQLGRLVALRSHILP